MNGARIDVDHVAGMHGYPVQELLHLLGVDRSLDVPSIGSRPQS